ncbi:MAG: hypothetical protein GEV11_21385 [Streptosporangiales bacterium]|nr:hypothetical protein [Streptosporangiales bacterium]
MRYWVSFLAGFGVGYVFGSRAGRARYEELKRTARRIADSPSAQGLAGVAEAQARSLIGRTRKALAKRHA